MPAQHIVLTVQKDPFPFFVKSSSTNVTLYQTFDPTMCSSRLSIFCCLFSCVVFDFYTRKVVKAYSFFLCFISLVNIGAIDYQGEVS